MVFCSKCGEENNDSAIYCQKCGHLLNDNTKIVKDNKKSINIKGIIIGAILVLVIAFIMASLTDSQQERFENTPPLTEEGAEQKEVINQMYGEDVGSLTNVLIINTFTYPETTP